MQAPQSVVFRPARVEDAAAIGPRLRGADRREAGFIRPGMGADEIVSWCIASTLEAGGPCVTCDVGHEPALVFGVRPDGHGGGVTWLLCTDVPDRYPRLFARYSRRQLAAMAQPLAPIRLYNTVWSENHVARKWLRWLGFREMGSFRDRHGVPWVRVMKELA